MNYLHIFEDMSMKQVNGQDLTDEDKQNINDGILTVIRFRGNQFEEAGIDGNPPTEQDGEELTIEWKPIRS